MSTGDSQFVSTKEAADLIGVSVRTVQLWVEAGVLQAWKTQGGHRRIVRASIDEFLRRRAAEAGGGGPLDPGPLRLVIVEDDPHLQAMYELAVASLPFPVDYKTAGDGFSGLMRIGEFQPHVVIADLNLPGLDGFRMIRALREAPETRHTELLVVSALSESDIADRGGLPSGVKVLAKPLPMSALEQMLAAAYDRLLAEGSLTS